VTRALPTIFSFFLGLMLVAFVGIGVNTFHPPPERYAEEQRAIQREMESLGIRRPEAEQTPAERATLDSLRAERDRVSDAAREAQEAWQRSTSIVLITIATLIMAVSLVRAEQLQVLSNGLLLGGVFTMLYGIGWLIATGASPVRFAVMSVAFAITLALGWLRFVRLRSAATAPAEAAEAADLDGLVRRVRELERRLDGAAAAMRTRDEHG
jgi:hypothetical protein